MPTISPSALELVSQSAERIATLAPDAARRRHSSGAAVFVDLREEDERRRHGVIPGAVHVPRGELEFYFDSSNPLHLPALESGDSFVLFCAGGWRSALAADTLTRLGVKGVFHMAGGLSAWVAAGGPVAFHAPKAASEGDAALAR